MDPQKSLDASIGSALDANGLGAQFTFDTSLDAALDAAGEQGRPLAAETAQPRGRKRGCGFRSEEIVRAVLEKLLGCELPCSRPEWLGGLELDGYCEARGVAFEYNARFAPQFCQVSVFSTA